MWKFGSRSAGATQSAPEGCDFSAPLMDGVSADKVVETLSDVLKGYGRYAFDVDGYDASVTNDMCDRWAKHVLYAAPKPIGTSKTNSPEERDWNGLRHFVTEHRQREHAHATRTVGDMRETIWTFIEELNNSLVDGNSTDTCLREQLDRMKSAMGKTTIDEMRSEISVAATAISRTIESRKNSQQRQVESLYSQIKELGGQLEVAKQESTTDGLTRLCNRKALDEFLDRTAMMQAVFGRNSCLLMIDADHFKSVNDTHGHAIGDEVLKALASTLTTVFHRKGDFVGRYGGEEFAVIIPDTTVKDAMMMADKLLKAIRNLTVDANGKPLKFTVSIGVASTQTQASAAEWIKRADAALYRAKETGRDRVVEL